MQAPSPRVAAGHTGTCNLYQHWTPRMSVLSAPSSQLVDSPAVCLRTCRLRQEIHDCVSISQKAGDRLDIMSLIDAVREFSDVHR